MTRRTRPRGFTLLHMLVAMPLIGIFLFIGSKLFISNTQLLKVTDQTEERLLRIDRVVHQLREDAWGARSIDFDVHWHEDSQGDEQVLTFSKGDTAFRWSILSDGTLTRRINENEPLVMHGLKATKFKRQGGAVILHLAGEQHLCPLGRSVTVAENGGKP